MLLHQIRFFKATFDQDLELYGMNYFSLQSKWVTNVSSKSEEEQLGFMFLWGSNKTTLQKKYEKSITFEAVEAV